MGATKNIVYIPYKNYAGGPGTFIRQLTDNFKDEKYTNTYTPDFDFILVITYYNPILLIYYKYILKKKILLRLDALSLPKYHLKYNFMKQLLTFYSCKLIYKSLANIIVFQGDYSRSIIQEIFGLTNKETQIINNCLEVEVIKNNHNFKKNVRLGYWGSGISKEQFELLIEIESAFHNLNNNSSITIIGPLRFDIDSNTSKSLTDRVMILGQIENNLVYEFYKNIDIFLMIKGSAYPNALVEALALSIPVVGLDKYGNKEIINEDVGILFPEVESRTELVEKFVLSILHVTNNYSWYAENVKERYKTLFDVKIMREKYNYIWSYKSK